MCHIKLWKYFYAEAALRVIVQSSGIQIKTCPEMSVLSLRGVPMVEKSPVPLWIIG